MSGATLAMLLGALGVGAIVSAIVSGLFAKRKLGAEATEIITKAASGVVQNMQVELDRVIAARLADQSEHNARVDAIQDSHDREIRRLNDVFTQTMQEHVAWDIEAIARCRDAGIILAPAPALLPPRPERGLGEV